MHDFPLRWPSSTGIAANHGRAATLAKQLCAACTTYGYFNIVGPKQRRVPVIPAMNPDRYINRRRTYLAELASKQNSVLRYYRDALDDIETGILPLVYALDTPLTTPIFSCQGHWIERSEPYVRFVVLPGKELEFQRFVSNLVRTVPLQFLGMRFEQRLQPMHIDLEPFIDWQMTIEIPFNRIRSPKSYAIRSQYDICRYAEFMIDEMGRWQARMHGKNAVSPRCQGAATK